METKTFYSVFGNKYELDVLTENEVREKIIEIDQEEVLEKLIGKHVNGNRTVAYFDISTGKVRYHSFIGNTDLQERAHLIELEEVTGNTEEGLTIEDFLDEEEIEKIKKEDEDEDFWMVIRNLNDYDERLIDAWKFYYNGFNDENIEEQLTEIYQK